MAEKNDAQKRIQDDFEPVFPGENIICKDCEFRLKRNRTDFTNAYCEVYTREISNGKPNGILFRNEDCKYYLKEEKAE